MPAIAHALTRGTPGTSVSDTPEDAQCTSAALANGDEFLVVGLAGFRVEGASTEYSQIEGRFGTTRLGLSRWEHAFDQFNTGDSSAGCVFGVAARVIGDGSSTLNMRVNCETAGYPTVRYGSQAWLAINLSELSENSDYWVADSSSGDTAEVTTTDDDVISLRFTMNGTIIGCEEPWVLTMPTDGAPSSSVGPTFLMLDVRPVTASTPYTLQWEFDDNGSWVEGDADGQLTFTPSFTGNILIIASCECIGTGTAIQYRRTRVFVFRLGAFSASPFIVNAGGIDFTNVGSGDEAEGVGTLTDTFGSGTEVVVFGSATHYGAGNWSAQYLRQQGSPDVDTPDPDGYFINSWDAPNDHYSLTTLDAATVSGSTSWNLVGQVDSGGNVRVGRDAANSDDSRALLIALVMETSSAPLTATPDAQRIRVRDGAPTATMARSVTPASERMRVRDTAPTANLGAVSNVPASQRVRFRDGAPTVALGALAVTPTTERLRIRDASLTASVGAVAASFGAARMRFRDGTLSLTIPDVYTPAAGRVRFVDGAPSVLLGARVYTPSAQRIRFRTGTVAGNAVIVGALRMGVREDQLFGGVVNEAQRFGLDVNDVD